MGRPQTAATREKQREATKRMMADPEYREKYAAAMQRPEVRARIAAAHRGKTLSLATRAKLSEATKRRMADPAYRAKIGAIRRRPEVRAKTAAAHTAAMRRVETRRRIGEAMKRQMADPAIRAARLGKARGKNRLETDAEGLLSPLGFIYEGRPFGKTLFDFTHPTLSSVVEIQGCYFHRHSAVGDCARKVRGLPGAAKKDERRREVAKSNGLRLLELWECERASWAATISSFMAQQK